MNSQGERAANIKQPMLPSLVSQQPRFLLRALTGVGFVPAFIDALTTVLLLLLLVSFFQMPWRPIYNLPALLTLIAYPLAASYVGVYRTLGRISFPARLLRILLAWSMVMALLLLISFATQMSELYSRRIFLTWSVLVPAVLGMLRLLLPRLGRWMPQSDVAKDRIAIYGPGPLARRLADALTTFPANHVELVGFYDDRDALPERREPCPILGGVEQLIDTTNAGKINSIYLVLPMRAELRIREIIERLADSTASVHWVPDLFAFRLLHSELSVIDGIPAISLFETPFRSIDAAIKRAEDVILSSIILMTIALPMIVIAIGVKLSSPGPVIFRQHRYGMDGQRIKVWKFRTMTVTEDDPDVIRQATRDDQRVTRFGAFLRRTSLDELPQFLNVLHGEMSVVGPRPHAIAHNEQYRRLIGGYMLRHKVKPGITGWAQMNGLRGETSTVEFMERRVQYDLAYIDNWSVLLDLYIVLLTVFKGFRHERAY